MMDFNQFAFWLLCSLLATSVLGVGWFFQALIVEIKGMRSEMSELNSKLAQVVTNQEWHARDILRLETRVNTLENKTNSCN
jgi:hypothetical protein